MNKKLNHINFKKILFKFIHLSKKSTFIKYFRKIYKVLIIIFLIFIILIL